MTKWMLIPGFDNYAVSNKGEIKNVRTNKICKSVLSPQGYLLINLCQNNFKKHFRVHRLVALLFIQNPDLKPYVNHIDGNKTNNNQLNLEWCTAKENNAHARQTGLMHNNFPVIVTTVNTNESFVFYSIGEAANFLGVHKSNLSRALKKRNGIYHGFKIQYLNL